MFELKCGKFTMLNVKLSLLSKTAVEYLPLSIVLSTSKYDSAVALSVVFLTGVLEDICPGLLHQIGYYLV